MPDTAAAQRRETYQAQRLRYARRRALALLAIGTAVAAGAAYALLAL